MRNPADKDAIKSVKDGVTSSNLSSFSPEANQEFRKSISKYIDILYEEAQKYAERHGSQQVSDTDVDHTAKFLFSPRQSLKLDIFNFIGTALVGLSLTLAVELITNTITYSNTFLAATFGSAVLGLILVFIYFIKR
jgi:histone H3/H4